MTTPTAHELQEGLGQTGRFGEIFIGLGLLILVFGSVLWWLGHSHALTTGFPPAGSDAITVGALFFFEGLGFTLFGTMVMLAGWGRHHGEA
ncbi:MAG: hypothetical protein QOD77_1987 [Thermoplasmata archaeon]|jgi:hypothetical protein|nr:hypothetical protein [Thermoplasmata archaeon]